MLDSSFITHLLTVVGVGFPLVWQLSEQMRRDCIKHTRNLNV